MDRTRELAEHAEVRKRLRATPSGCASREWRRRQRREAAANPGEVASADERLLVFAGGQAVAEVTHRSDGSEQTHYLHEDRLGSVAAITDESGLVERRKYEAFGKPRMVAPAATDPTHRGYTGHEYDPEFGLVNMRARLYDPEVGRFLQADPIIAEPGWSQGLNAYSYVDNDPVNAVDPTGLIKVSGSFCIFGLGPGCTDSDDLGSLTGAGAPVGRGIANNPNDLGTFGPSGSGGFLGDGQSASGPCDELNASCFSNFAVSALAFGAVVASGFGIAEIIKELSESGDSSQSGDAPKRSGKRAKQAGSQPVSLWEAPAIKETVGTLLLLAGAYRPQPLWGTDDRSSNRVASYVDEALESVDPMMAMAVAVTDPLAARGTRAVNLPGWRKVTVDIAHIAERHMEGGALTAGRDVFVNLNERGVMAAVKQAYASATTVSIQGERVLLSGLTKTGMTVEMWFNKATKLIETAYPVSR